MPRCLTFVIIVLVVALALDAANARAQADKDFFESRIRPESIVVDKSVSDIFEQELIKHPVVG